MDLGRRLPATEAKPDSAFDPLKLMAPHWVEMVKAANNKLECFAMKRIAQPAASVLFVLCTKLDEGG